MSVSICGVLFVISQLALHAGGTYVCASSGPCGPACTSAVGGGCQSCAPGTYKNTTGSQACMTCPLNTYSETMSFNCTVCPLGLLSPAGSTAAADCCSPRSSFVENPYYALLAIQPKLLLYAVRVSVNPALGGLVTAGNTPKSPIYQASGGYNGNAFLAFRKTNKGSGHSYMDTDETPVTWTNGLAVVAVVRILEPVVGAIWSMQRSNEYVAFQIHTIVSQGIFKLCVSAYNSANHYPSRCTKDSVPLDVWLQVTYTYNRTRIGYGTLDLTYVNTTGVPVSLSSGVLGNFAGSMDVQEFTPRKFVLGYSAVTDCAGNFPNTQIRLLDSLGNVENGNNCDRPNFDLAGFYFIQTLLSPAQISLIFQAIASGRQIAYDNSIAGRGNTGVSCSVCRAVETCTCDSGYGYEPPSI
jgi:hypothetical protein